jgi:hypothetical protein
MKKFLYLSLISCLIISCSNEKEKVEEVFRRAKFSYSLKYELAKGYFQKLDTITDSNKYNFYYDEAAKCSYDVILLNRSGISFIDIYCDESNYNLSDSTNRINRDLIEHYIYVFREISSKENKIEYHKFTQVFSQSFTQKIESIEALQNKLKNNILNKK